MSLSDCEHCWETHCRHNCAPIVQPAVQAAIMAERERIIGVIAEETLHYSKAMEQMVPAQVAAVFANSVASKIRSIPVL